MAYSTLPTVVTLDVYSKAAHYDPTRDSLIACAHATFELGGSRVFAISAGGSAQDAPDYNDFIVPTSAQNGFAFRVEVEIRTDDAATTVTPRLYNVTDSTVTWTGSAGTATTWGTYQTSGTLTILTGKRYRLQATKSDDAVDAFIKGRIVRTAA